MPDHSALEPSATPEKSASAAGKRSLSDRVGDLLAETERLEAEIRRLEEGIPPLLARFEAAEAPLVEEIEARRTRLISRIEANLPTGKRQKRLLEKGVALLLFLARDLEERFGADMRALRDRWAGAVPSDTGAEDPEAEERLRSTGPSPSTARIARRLADPDATAKDIYRNLARELHPDKTRDDEERIRRTGLMQSLTRAWQERDLGALLRLLHAHGSRETKANSVDEASLEACVGELESARKRLQERRRTLRHGGLPQGAADWMELVGNDVLVERLLRQAKDIARRELAAVRELEKLLSSPEDLLAFLRETDPEDWEEMA
ncbi:MAG TPA: hypothetical protein VN931_11410 [Fibrobacteria bacterium]|nr:hypothetical protein [Fibrobacteria bacterium]